MEENHSLDKNYVIFIDDLLGSYHTGTLKRCDNGSNVSTMVFKPPRKGWKMANSQVVTEVGMKFINLL